MAPIDQPNRYSQRFHYKNHKMPTIRDHNFDGNFLPTSSLSGDDDSGINDFSEMGGSFDSTDSESVSSRRPQNPYKLVKKALGLFAYWKPSLYTSSGGNSITSGFVIVPRGHYKPIGRPLRWGRR